MNLRVEAIVARAMEAFLLALIAASKFEPSVLVGPWWLWAACAALSVYYVIRLWSGRPAVTR